MSTNLTPVPAPAAVAAVNAPATNAVGVAPWRTPLELTVLGAIWGGSFLFMRVAAADFGPLPLVEARLALGALVPYTLLVILPTNKRLLDATLDAGSVEAQALLARWGRLHAVRTVVSLAVVAGFVAVIARR